MSLALDSNRSLDDGADADDNGVGGDGVCIGGDALASELSPCPCPNPSPCSCVCPNSSP